MADQVPSDRPDILQRFLALQPRPDGAHHGRHAAALARRGDEGGDGLPLVARVDQARDLRLPQHPHQHDDSDPVLRGRVNILPQK